MKYCGGYEKISYLLNCPSPNTIFGEKAEKKARDGSAICAAATGLCH